MIPILRSCDECFGLTVKDIEIYGGCIDISFKEGRYIRFQTTGDYEDGYHTKISTSEMSLLCKSMIGVVSDEDFKRIYAEEQEAEKFKKQNEKIAQYNKLKQELGL